MGIVLTGSRPILFNAGFQVCGKGRLRLVVWLSNYLYNHYAENYIHINIHKAIKCRTRALLSGIIQR